LRSSFTNAGTLSSTCLCTCLSLCLFAHYFFSGFILLPFPKTSPPFLCGFMGTSPHVLDPVCLFLPPQVRFIPFLFHIFCHLLTPEA
jgi:hypothetical protein